MKSVLVCVCGGGGGWGGEEAPTPVDSSVVGGFAVLPLCVTRVP